MAATAVTAADDCDDEFVGMGWRVVKEPFWVWRQNWKMMVWAMAALHFTVKTRWEMGVQYAGFADRPGPHTSKKVGRVTTEKRHKYTQKRDDWRHGSRKNGGNIIALIYTYIQTIINIMICTKRWWEIGKVIEKEGGILFIYLHFRYG